MRQCVHARALTHTLTYRQTCTLTHTHAPTYANVRTKTHREHTHTHTHTHTHGCTHAHTLMNTRQRAHTRARACTHTHTHTHTHTNTHTHTHTHILLNISDHSHIYTQHIKDRAWSKTKQSQPPNTARPSTENAGPKSSPGFRHPLQAVRFQDVLQNHCRQRVQPRRHGAETANRVLLIDCAVHGGTQLALWA